MKMFSVFFLMIFVSACGQTSSDLSGTKPTDPRVANLTCRLRSVGDFDFAFGTNANGSEGYLRNYKTKTVAKAHSESIPRPIQFFYTFDKEKIRVVLGPLEKAPNSKVKARFFTFSDPLDGATQKEIGKVQCTQFSGRG